MSKDEKSNEESQSEVTEQTETEMEVSNVDIPAQAELDKNDGVDQT